MFPSGAVSAHRSAAVNGSEESMPVISRFLGIVITMYYNDHEPSHFHARYGDFEITVVLGSGVISGSFPRRALQLVLEWARFTGRSSKRTGPWCVIASR